MSWRDIELIWSDTEHEWNELGTIISSVELGDDEFYAKNVYIWRGVDMGKFVDEGVSLIQNLGEFSQSPSVVAGLFITVASLNLFPVFIERIQEDEHAEQFLKLVKKYEGQHYFLESELSKFPEIDYLIDHFIQLKLLRRSEEKLIVEGKVLNRVHVRGT